MVAAIKDAVFRFPLSIATLATLFGVVFSGLGLAWHGATQVADIRYAVAAVARDLDNAKAAGIREREALAQRVQAADALHTQQLSALTVASASMSESVAVIRADMSHIRESVRQLVERRQ